MFVTNLFRRHRWFEANIDAFADSALPAAERRRMGAHLESCATCPVRLREVRELRSLVQALPELEAPRSFALTPAMLREPVPAGSGAPRSFLNPMRMSQGVAAAAMAIFAVLVVVDVSGTGSGGLAPASEDAINTMASGENGEPQGYGGEDDGSDERATTDDVDVGAPGVALEGDDDAPVDDAASDGEFQEDPPAESTREVSGAGVSGEPTPAPTLDPSRDVDPEDPEAPDGDIAPDAAGQDGGGDESPGNESSGERVTVQQPETAPAADGALRASRSEPGDGVDGLRIAQVAFGGLALAAAVVYVGARFRSRGI